jgi:uncharacterized membrane protein
MLAVAIIFSITANLDKMGLKHLSALHWLALMQLGIALVLSIFVMIKVKNVSSVITSNFRQLLVIGLCNGLMIVSYMLGLKTGLVAYIVSLKRLSVLLTVCYGAMIYKEQGMKERLLGSLVMVVGVILIAFG